MNCHVFGCRKGIWGISLWIVSKLLSWHEKVTIFLHCKTHTINYPGSDLLLDVWVETGLVMVILGINYQTIVWFINLRVSCLYHRKCYCFYSFINELLVIILSSALFHKKNQGRQLNLCNTSILAIYYNMDT